MTTSQPLPHPFRGIVPPLVTPLSADGELDIDGLRRLVEHVLAGGVHGLFLLGTCGEGPALPYQLRKELIATTCQIVNGRVPVLAGITDASVHEAVLMAENAAEAGAAAAVMAPPFYFPMSQQDLIRASRFVADGSPIPLFLYNMPGLTGTWFEHDSLKQLFPHPNISGLKDSSGDLEYLETAIVIARQFGGLSVFLGPEGLLPQAIALGADGGVSGGANVFPELFVTLFRALDAGRTAQAEFLADIVTSLQAIYLPKSATGVIQGLKTALQHLNICGDTPAVPRQSADPERRRHVGEVIDQLTPLACNPLGASASS